MSSINGRYKYNLEDNICWEELAPSLQDKFKALWAIINNIESYLNSRTGDVRVTVGPTPPQNPVEYAEFWIDTNFMAIRIFMEGKWEFTRGAWYGTSARDVFSTTESRLSSNPRTNCHCYIVKFENAGFCHCKMQLWDPSTVEVGSESPISFNKAIEVNYSSTMYFRFIINAATDGVVIQTLNTTDDIGNNTNAIVPKNNKDRQIDHQTGQYVYYCDYDDRYNAIFDGTTNTEYGFNKGITIIPIKYSSPMLMAGVFCRLNPYSKGPVTITLQAHNNGSFMTIMEKTLRGN